MPEGGGLGIHQNGICRPFRPPGKFCCCAGYGVGDESMRKLVPAAQAVISDMVDARGPGDNARSGTRQIDGIRRLPNLVVHHADFRHMPGERQDRVHKIFPMASKKPRGSDNPIILEVFLN